MVVSERRNYILIVEIIKQDLPFFFTVFSISIKNHFLWVSITELPGSTRESLNSKMLWKRSTMAHASIISLFLPNVHSCFCNLTGTRKCFFYFLCIVFLTLAYTQDEISWLSYPKIRAFRLTSFAVYNCAPKIVTAR